MKIKKFQICIVCIFLLMFASGCGEVKDDLYTPYNEEAIIQKQNADLPKDSEKEPEREDNTDSEIEKPNENAVQELPTEEEQKATALPETETEEGYASEELSGDSETALEPDFAEEPEPYDGEAVDYNPNPEEQAANAQTNVCTLTVRCDTVLTDIEKLAKEKIPLIPQDGVIYAARELEFKTGESVFDLLKREMTENGIHMEFTQSTGYKSAYVEGINNLYEFDCGDLSGWVYRVNGKLGNVGCSQYMLQPGDVVEWVYTCDMGRDVK